jgi:hypothetical protein
MYDLAHACLSCRTITIFAKDSAYPRRCGCCDTVLRAAPNTDFVPRPAVHDDDDAFTLELGPASIQAAPF